LAVRHRHGAARAGPAARRGPTGPGWAPGGGGARGGAGRRLHHPDPRAGDNPGVSVRLHHRHVRGVHSTDRRLAAAPPGRPDRVDGRGRGHRRAGTAVAARVLARLGGAAHAGLRAGVRAAHRRSGRVVDAGGCGRAGRRPAKHRDGAVCRLLRARAPTTATGRRGLGRAGPDRGRGDGGRLPGPDLGAGAPSPDPGRHRDDDGAGLRWRVRRLARRRPTGIAPVARRGAGLGGGVFGVWLGGDRLGSRPLLGGALVLAAMLLVEIDPRAQTLGPSLGSSW